MTVDGAANLDWLTAGVMLRKYWLLLAALSSCVSVLLHVPAPASARLDHSSVNIRRT